MERHRLEEIRLALKLNKVEFAKLMGITANYYSHISLADGKGNLRVEHIHRLLESANVNPVWLLTGKGVMFLTGISDQPAGIEPTEEQIGLIYKEVTSGEKIDVSTMNIASRQMILLVCAQVAVEFPDANTIRELSFAARSIIRAKFRLPDMDIVKALGVEMEANKILGQD